MSAMPSWLRRFTRWQVTANLRTEVSKTQSGSGGGATSPAKWLKARSAFTEKGTAGRPEAERVKPQQHSNSRTTLPPFSLGLKSFSWQRCPKRNLIF